MMPGLHINSNLLTLKVQDSDYTLERATAQRGPGPPYS